jgi:hypothetical protein
MISPTPLEAMPQNVPQAAASQRTGSLFRAVELKAAHELEEVSSSKSLPRLSSRPLESRYEETLPPEPVPGSSPPLPPSQGTQPAKGAVLAGQTQMARPIQIDQTQFPQTPVAPKKSVTIQDLNVSYEKLSFMTPLEIVYYKLLRGALKQYLIFPNVTSRAVVKAISKEPEHQKIADNVLSGTSVSFIVCDVRLNIRAVVEIIDESQVPSNKDKARDFILKKAGCLIVRFYSGDKPPDVETLRLQIIGSI